MEPITDGPSALRLPYTYAANSDRAIPSPATNYDAMGLTEARRSLYLRFASRIVVEDRLTRKLVSYQGIRTLQDCDG